MTTPQDDLVTPPQGPFFRFPDEAIGMAALRDAGFTRIDEDGIEQVITASHHHSLDVIGIITRGGAWDSETGEQLEPPVVLDGWHVNLAGDLPEGWEEFVVEPVHPVRVWA